MANVCTYQYELLVMLIVLGLMSIAGLIYTAINARRSALGSALLAACDNDYTSAAITVEDARQARALLDDVMRRGMRDDKA